MIEGSVDEAGVFHKIPRIDDSRLAEEEPKPVPSKGWAEMIRKVYEIDPMVCPKCTSDYYCFS